MYTHNRENLIISTNKELCSSFLPDSSEGEGHVWRGPQLSLETSKTQQKQATSGGPPRKCVHLICSQSGLIIPFVCLFALIVFVYFMCMSVLPHVCLVSLEVKRGSLGNWDYGVNCPVGAGN